MDSPRPPRTHVIAGYFMWNNTTRAAWNDTPPRSPLLGNLDKEGKNIGYNQTAPTKIAKTLQWAQAHGVRVMAPIWRGNAMPGCDARMADRIEIFRTELAKQDYPSMRWCVFLGNILLEDRKPPKQFDFGTPGNPTPAYRNLVESLTVKVGEHGWFDDEKYFRLNGKPVVVVFRSKDYHGNYQGAIDEIRNFYQQQIYLVGMGAQWHRPYDTLDAAAIDRIRAFDAVTAWSATAGTPPTRKDMKGVANFLGQRLPTWRENVPKLVVKGTANTKVTLVPTITAQYDKEKIMGNPNPTRWARNKEDFRAAVRVAKDNLDPNGVAGTGDKLVWLQTFNEWPEGTCCEPSELGEGYPYRADQYRHNYGFEFLEVLRQEFFPGFKRSPREAILISPRDRATVTTTTPTFRWDRVDANPPVTHYRLKIIDETKTVVFNRKLSVEELEQESTYTLPAGAKLKRDTEYRWQIRVFNDWKRSTSKWSRRWRFRTA